MKDQEVTMFRKSIIALVLVAALLLIVFTLASAQAGGREIGQMDMGTPTATLPPTVTPVPSLPLQGDLPLSNTQTGTCPMMSGTAMSGTGTMTGMNMGGMAGMSGMSGMQGMSGMTGMQGMSGMNMTGMSGTMAYYATPWYNDPWLMLGWILVGLVVVGILTGIILGIRWLVRSSKQVPPAASS
jgi:hypothetical protein